MTASSSRQTIAPFPKHDNTRFDLSQSAVKKKHTSSGSAQSNQAADDSGQAVQMWSPQPVRRSPAAHLSN